MKSPWMVGAALAVVLIAGALLWRGHTAGQSAPRGDVVQVVRREGAAAPAVSVAAAPTPVPSAASAPVTAADGARIADDPAIEAGLPDAAMDPRALYRQLRSEARDPVWAPRAESSVKAALADIPYVDRAGGPTIRCAASLCEVHGTFAQASDDNTNVAMQQLQGDVLRRRLGAAGLDQGLAAFTGGNKQSGFTLYLRRQ